jgi:two-component system chemotaxis response regulator CheY
MKPKTVLIIEDSVFIRQLLIENVSELQMQVVAECADPAQGINLFETFRPDITLIDYSLPDMNGLRVAEELLKQNFYARLILMVPHRMLPESQNIIALGLRAVVIKPFYPERLQTLLIEVAEN